MDHTKSKVRRDPLHSFFTGIGMSKRFNVTMGHYVTFLNAIMTLILQCFLERYAKSFHYILSNRKRI